MSSTVISIFEFNFFDLFSSELQLTLVSVDKILKDYDDDNKKYLLIIQILLCVINIFGSVDV